MNYKKPAFWVILIALIVSIVVAVCFLTNPKDVLPVTIDVDYVSRTGADLKFTLSDDFGEDEIQISDNYILEVQDQGEWKEVEKLLDKTPNEMVIDVQLDSARFDSWTSINWGEIYGRLPDGTFRLRKDVTINQDSGESETYPIYVEFTIGGVADEYVTYTLEDITPTGAKLYEHEKAPEEFQLIYDGSEGIWLESYQDGQWAYVEPTEYMEPILKKDRNYIQQLIYPSDYIQLDWSALYGELPDGTYRIAREVTNTAEEDLCVCTAYVEFDISTSPVTISLENARPTGATILFHQNQELITGSLLCNYEYFLQQQVNGKWEDLPKNAEIPFPDQTYDIAVLHHNGVDWEQLYGRLPVGYYRLGKVIPITSGDDPEYETVYAEFSIDNAYTWFDRYSTDSNEHSPKDTLVELFGLENVTLSYDAAENTIYRIDAEGRNPVISCSVLIRNVFLTDLTGDGISEVCATVQNDHATQVQVYDASEQKLYELPVEGIGHKLTKKADRLCIYWNDEMGNQVGYWQLALEPGKGIVLADLDPEVEALKSRLVCVDVNTRKRVCLSSGPELNQIMTLLRNLQDTVEPATAEDLAAAEKEFDTTWITINYELGEKDLFFSENYDLVWKPGSGEAYRIPKPDPFRLLFESVTDGVRNKETSGKPFATVDTPWDWCAGVSTNAISDAEVYVCLDVTSNGLSKSVSGASGVLPTDRLSPLIDVLNQVQREAFSDSGRTEKTFRWFGHEQTEGSASISVLDGVNQLAVAIRIRDGYLEMIMTEELDKALDSTSEYLNPAAKIWTIQDSALCDFMKKLAENPTVINYSVGAEYDWQGPIEFAKGKFDLELYLIEDWIYEEVKNATNSGVRCRPQDVSEGWLYFSFWPNGYSVQEEDRYYEEGGWSFFTRKTSYPSSVKSSTGIDTRHVIWSYQVINTDIGDFAIINDGADEWFLEYEDEISDTLTILQFTTE